MKEVSNRAATPQRGADAAGLPLHPVCRDRQSRVHLVATVGHKYLTCVVLPQGVGGLHLVQVDAFEHGLEALTLKKDDGTVGLYPLKRALKMFREHAKEKGITDGARDALASLREEVTTNKS